MGSMLSSSAGMKKTTVIVLVPDTPTRRGRALEVDPDSLGMITRRSPSLPFRVKGRVESSRDCRNVQRAQKIAVLTTEPPL